MTTRKLLFIDRVATLVLSLALLAGGAAALWWWDGRTIAGVTPVESSDVAPVSDTIESSWFPWVAAVIGVLLALVGLRWIVAHLTPAGVKRLRLGGSSGAGRLEVAADKVAGAAAESLGDMLGVRSASGSVLRDRGQMVARLKVTAEPDVDLALLAARADTVSAQLATALEREDLRCDVRVSIATSGRSLSRAR